mmetsp:Transcript_9645/g.29005  ORF Transcript_9645/g.29005 Transcript_9645/m.29005 type:complete len:136 (-) Transcript_9645:95-502(-)
MVLAAGLGLLKKSAWWVAAASGAVKSRCKPTLGKVLQRAAESRTNRLTRGLLLRCAKWLLERHFEHLLRYRAPPGTPTEWGLGTFASRRRLGSCCVRCRKDPYVELVGLYGVTEKVAPSGVSAAMATPPCSTPWL